MLQQQLEEIRNNHYVMDTINMDSLISNMLKHIGVTDSYLRTNLFALLLPSHQKGLPFTHTITETIIRKHQ